MAARTGDAPIHYQALVAGGNSQATATLIGYEASPAFITAVGNDLVGLRLPPPGKGKVYYVSNQGVTQMANLYVYPPTGVQINSLGSNNPLTLLPQTATMFVASGTQWFTCPVVPS
jgi:hypothetical protein